MPTVCALIFTVLGLVGGAPAQGWGGDTDRDRAARDGGKLTLSSFPRYFGSTGALATALLLPARRFVV